jgi:hypothetical protein
MGQIDDSMPLRRLVMPASHNASSYTTKNFIMKVKDYVMCQDLCIYD